MKKFLTIIVFGLLVSGCEAKDGATQLIKDTEASYHNVVNEVNTTVENIEKAKQEIDEATSAIKEIVE